MYVERSAAAHRFKIFQPIEMEWDGARVRTHLLDLSVSGALAHADVPPAIGSRIGAGALGRADVVWVDGKRFGIVFLAPLSDAQIADALDSRRALLAAGARRLQSLRLPA